MTTKGNFLRWLLLVPASLAAATAAQLIIGAVIGRTLVAILGVELLSAFSRNAFSVSFALKPVQAFFVGAIFLLTARFIAPTRKQGIAISALGVVLVWGGYLVVGAFYGTYVHGWLLAMGFAGATGGVLAFLLSRERPDGTTTTSVVSQPEVRSVYDHKDLSPRRLLTT